MGKAFMIPTWMVDLLLAAEGAPEGAAPVPAPGPGPAPAGAQPNFFQDIQTLLFPIVVIFLIFWLLVFRPESKKRKDREAMIAAVKKGDTVVTSGGMIGKVWKVEAGEVVIVIDKDRDTKCRFTKSAILDVVREPAAAEGKGAAGAEETQKA